MKNSKVLQYVVTSVLVLVSLGLTTSAQPPPPVPGQPSQLVIMLDKEAIPVLPPEALIVDEQSSSFGRVGSEGWVTVTGSTNDYYNGQVLWTPNTETAYNNYGYWYLPVASGLYEVFAFMPRYNATAKSATYQIVHGGASNFYAVDQSNAPAQWVSLGKYQFGTNDGNYILLTDHTGEAYGTTQVAFDAIAFVPAAKVYLPLVTRERISFYNRTEAVLYADQWAHGRNGNYPDYGTGCSCNDCTNYASQVLHEGDYPLREGDWNPDSILEWWYKKVLLWYENSKTWSVTDWFNTYVHQYPEEFEGGDFGKLTNGDFLVMDTWQNEGDGPPDGIPDHVRIIVGYGNTSTNIDDYGCQPNPVVPPSIYTLLANQHCVDRWHVAWDYNFQPTFGLWYTHVRW